MMRLTAFLLACGLTAALSAQNQVFWTEADYPNAGVTVLGEINVEPRMGRFMITYTIDGQPKATPCRKIWGFKYDDVLYRIAPEGGMPVRLMAQGAVYYWENGFAHLHMQRDSIEAAAFHYGRPSYLSKDLLSEIVPASFAGKGKTKAAENFKEQYAAYADMLQCIGAGANLDSTRQCVVEYEVAVEEGRATKP